MRVLALMFLVAACSEPSSVPDPEREPVALVGGAPIEAQEFKRELARLRIDTSDTLISAATNDVQKRALIEHMVDRKLVLREAEARNVLVGIDEVEAELHRMRLSWAEGKFDEGLEKRDVTAAELKREIRNLLTVRRFFRDHVFSRVAVTDEEVEAYLQAHPDFAVVPERVRARHIVVENEDKAKEVLAEVRRGLAFEEAAMQYSKSPDGQSGGDLGFFKRGEMPKVFDEVCFSHPPGVVNKVVASDYGFHLFKVIEKRPETARPLDSVREEIESLLLKKKQREAQSAYVKKLREATTIEIKESKLASIY
ncbi:MAG: peptidylprolyl isomerase [Myxococcota bacterium]